MKVTRMEQKNVHNKTLLTEVTENLKVIVVLLDLTSDIEDIVNLIELGLLEQAETYKLETGQINVVCDSRNNKHSEMEKGKFIIDIYYKHKMCFNTTHLSFKIER
jgi:hypothetical protein